MPFVKVKKFFLNGLESQQKPSLSEFLKLSSKKELTRSTKPQKHDK